MDIPDPIAFQIRWAFLSSSWTPVAAAAAFTSAAFLLAMPFVKPIRKTLLPKPSEPTFRSACPFDKILEDGQTVRCRGNRILRAWRFTGIDHTTMTSTSRTNAYRGRCSALDSIADSRLSLRFVTVRFPTRANLASHGSVPSDLPEPITEMLTAWNASFDSHSTYLNRHWLLAYGPNSGATRQTMTQLSDRLAASMGDYNPELLSCNPAASLAEPLSALLSPTAPHAPTVAPGEPLSDLLCTAAFAFRNGHFHFRSHETDLYFLPMGIRALPEAMTESTVASLLRVPAPLIIHHLIQPTPKARAIVDLARMRASSRAFSLGGSGAADELTEALSVLEGSHQDTPTGNLFVHQMCILAGASHPDALPETASLIHRELAPSGATAVSEGLAAQNAYWSLFPTIDTPHRPFRLLTPHLATWILPQTTPCGLETSDWCDQPIATFRSAERTPYQFQWHVTDEPEAVAHCMVVAPTGSGKTTLLSFLAANTLALPDSHVWLFDRYNGAEIFVRSAGGDYLRFDGDSAIRMNPFLLEDTLANRSFLREWIASLIPEPSPDDRDDISRMVQVAYDSLPPSRRSLAALYKGSLRPGSSARHYLAQWVMPDQNGHIFNAPIDNATEGLGSRLTAYDCTAAFNDPNLAAPLISYLSHRIRALSAATARPTLVYIDETAPMLRTPQFRETFEAGLREGRKQRQAYACAFQDPAAISNSGIGHVLRGQCQTAILLRNRQANADDYKDLQLTDTEFAFVSGLTHREMRHAALLKRYPTGETTIIDTSLQVLGPYLRLFASGNRNVQKLRTLTEQLGHRDAIRTYMAG